MSALLDLLGLAVICVLGYALLWLLPIAFS